MLPDKQHNPMAMPLDSEDMKGFEVDGSIPDRYRGSAGEQMNLPHIAQECTC